MRAESERLEEESRRPGRQEEEEEGGPFLEDLRPASEPISQGLPLWRATWTGGVHRCFTEFRDTFSACQVHLKRAEEILHLGLTPALSGTGPFPRTPAPPLPATALSLSPGLITPGGHFYV